MRNGGGTGYGRRRFVGQAAAASALGLFGCAKTPMVRALLAGSLGGDGPAPKAAPRRLAVDVHCHVFNARDLPIDGFLRNVLSGALSERLGTPGEALVRLVDPWLARLTGRLATILLAKAPADEGALLDRYLATPKETLPGAEALAATKAELRGALATSVAERGGETGRALAELADGVADALSLLASPRYLVVTSLLDDSPGIQVFTPSLIDFDLWTQRHLGRNVAGCADPLARQVELHAKISVLAARGQLPTREPNRKVALHSFAPFNPLRDGALDAVKEALTEHGFVGVKLYPATGFLPTNNARLPEFDENDLGQKIDDALDALYEYCEEEGVPVLSHTSPSNGFGYDLAWRGSPWGWAEVLKNHPGLRLNLGHFGHMTGVPRTGEIKERELLDCIVWAKRTVDLMKTYGGVYADLSCSTVGTAEPAADTSGCLGQDPKVTGAAACYAARFEPFLEQLIAACKEVPDRLMYGSDWWMTVLGGTRGEFLTRLREFAKKVDGLDPDRFLGENARAFLGLPDQAGKEGKTSERVRSYFKAKGVADLAWDPQATPTVRRT